MTIATDMIQHAKEVRHRLMYPSNGVEDKGIDLHPKQIPQEVEVLEHPIIRVFIQEIVKIPSFEPKRVEFSTIIHEVSNYYKVGIKEMVSPDRNKYVTMARHMTMFLARNHTTPRLSYAAISMRFNRDHTSVVNAVWKIQELMLVDDGIAADIRNLESRLLYPNEPDHRGPALAAIG